MQNDKDEYHKRLQRRLLILKDELSKGKVHFKAGLQVVESLKAVKYAPDGTLDLSTVDASVRSLALAVEYVHNRTQIKQQVTLEEIQKTYFKIIHDNFGKFYDQMQKNRTTPHAYAKFLSSQSEVVKSIDPSIDEFMDLLTEFWESFAQAAYIHVEDMTDATKGVFGGDLFPTHNQNIASKCGLYLDTIILPDPFLRCKDLFKRWRPEVRVFYLLKHALNVLQYEILALADLVPSIVVILPDLPHIYEEEKTFLMHWGEQDALIHARHLFGRQFADKDQLLDFAAKLDTFEKVVQSIKEPERFLADYDEPRDMKTQLRISAEAQGEALCTTNPGIIVASMAFGRMTVSNEILLKGARLHATPLIDAPTSWEYFKWKLEYDSDRTATQLPKVHLHIVRALEDISRTELHWLGRVPPEALIEIRKAGALDEIRRIIGSGINKVTGLELEDFEKSTDTVLSNITNAFEEHSKQIEELRKKKWKFAGKDLGKWLVVGGIAITAAATGMPLFGLMAIAADQLLDAPKLREIPESLKALANQSKNLRNSPIGILFRYKKT